MTDPDDRRLQVALHALKHELASIEATNRLNWYESTRPSDATVLAFEVTKSDVRTQREELIGSAINDGKSLLLSTRIEDEWTISRMNADEYEVPPDDSQ
ncbi:hypothetical protein [Mycobacterium sp. E1747]|uniref:hypothetical protein n=1 Tax=Mycobacterium sp. E1747 TaxID=1834128 RepID=UPI0007FED431|nr:hypothetical protein [Mycobacterium sp. E1747]OBH10061.1 hypothetical protein A5695_22695 [Mycobacterium sp. E1747]